MSQGWAVRETYGRQKGSVNIKVKPLGGYCDRFIGYTVFSNKAQSAHSIRFDYIFNQNIHKAHLHSCHIHSGALFAFFSLSPLLSLSIFSFIISPSSSFMSLLQQGLKRQGWWLPSPASLPRFGCSCLTVIKKAKRRSFHTNYNTIMKCSVKGTEKTKVKQSFV